MTQEQALSILKTGANVFLTGEPGSGKTYTINEYTAWLRAHSIEPAITASTGIAATHIAGYTIHSWSGIGVKRSLSPYDLDAIASNKKVYGRVRDARVLIIDEVSMLSGTTLSMVEAVCREVRRDSRAFGGLQVILVGDFFQLPPVVKQEQLTDSPFAFNSGAWRNLKPLVCYLSEQHRQEDAAFLNLLTAIRRGVAREPERELLRTRYAAHAHQDITQLYSHNADVDFINTTELDKLAGDVQTFQMVSRGSEKLVAGLKKGCLSPEVLSLKVASRVMFTKNDSLNHRFANGTLGTVVGFAKEIGYPVVQTRSGRILVVEPMEWVLQDGGKVLAQITQVPLRLAWAMTVHKSQGMSLDAAHVDLSETFEYGQGYVALSRVRTLAGLSLAGLNARALQVHPEVGVKDKIFKEQSDLVGDAFSAMPPEELTSMHKNFIRASGGREATVGSKRKKDKTFSVSSLREKHPNAYRPWDKQEDAELKRRFDAGEQAKSLSQVFGRQPGAIRSRLVKLGLIE